MSKICSRPDCDRGTRTHELCLWHRPRKALAKSKKRINQHGKHADLWKEARAEWLLKHPPNFEGYYTCGICGQWVHVDEVTIDHIIPRSNDSRKRYDMNNLQPAHGLCNSEKGSKH